MKKTLFLLILIVFFTISFLLIVGCNSQKSNASEKQPRELQENCEKRSNEFFKKKYNGLRCNYINNYNKNLNKCFTVVYCNDGKPTQNFWDVNENKKLGDITYYKRRCVKCFMLDKECNSKAEWDKLLQTYMEE